jgi:hypothetical protein
MIGTETFDDYDTGAVIFTNGTQGWGFTGTIYAGSNWNPASI